MYICVCGQFSCGAAYFLSSVLFFVVSLSPFQTLTGIWSLAQSLHFVWASLSCLPESSLCFLWVQLSLLTGSISTLGLISTATSGLPLEAKNSRVGRICYLHPAFLRLETLMSRICIRPCEGWSFLGFVYHLVKMHSSN